MNNFTFFTSYYEAIKEFPEEEQGEIYKAIIDYAMEGKEPNLTGLKGSVFKLIKPYLDAQKRNVENGSKGGRPRKETQTETETLTQSETQTKTPLFEKGQENKNPNPNPNPNPNDNPTHNPSGNPNPNPKQNQYKTKTKLLVSYNNIKESIFSDYARTHECNRVPEKTERERQPFIDFFEDYFNFCISDELKNSAYEVIDTILEAFYQSRTEEKLRYSKVSIDDKLFCKYLGNIDCEKFQDIVSQVAFNGEINNRPSYILGCVIASGKSPAKNIDSEKIYTLITQLGELQ